MKYIEPETAITTGTGTYVNHGGKWYRVIATGLGPVLGSEVTPEEIFGIEVLRYLVNKPPPGIHEN